MEISLTDSLLLAAVLALLMVGYINRRVATARAVRSLTKDRLKGTRHHKQDKTMLVLRDRLSLQSSMLISAAFGGVLTFGAAIFTVLELNSIAKIVFIVALFFGLVSLVQAVRESIIANKAHFTELDLTISEDDPYYKSPAA